MFFLYVGGIHVFAKYYKKFYMRSFALNDYF